MQEHVDDSRVGEDRYVAHGYECFRVLPCRSKLRGTRMWSESQRTANRVKTMCKTLRMRSNLRAASVSESQLPDIIE